MLRLEFAILILLPLFAVSLDVHTSSLPVFHERHQIVLLLFDVKMRLSFYLLLYHTAEFERFYFHYKNSSILHLLDVLSEPNPWSIILYIQYSLVLSF